MKLFVSAVLCTTISAMKSSMLPFLMSQDFRGDSMLPLLAASGNIKSNMLPFLLSGQPNDMMTTLALSGNLGSKTSKNDFALPFLVNSMSNGRSPSLSQDVFPAMMMLDGKVKPEKMLPFLLTSGPRYAGNMNNMMPFLLGNDDLRIGSKDVLPWMMASNRGFDNNFMPFLLAGNKNVDMTLPLMVNSLSQGRSPSLSQDVIPALMMLNEEIEPESLLPFLMTSGQRYGGMMPLLAAGAGANDFDVDGLLPWMIAEQMSQPRPMQGMQQPRPYYNQPRSTMIPPNTRMAYQDVQLSESAGSPAFDTFEEQEQATGITLP